MSFQAVLFDLDGVIVDTVPLYYKATLPIVEEMGIAFNEEDNLKYQGRPRLDLIHMLVERSGETYSEEEKVELGERRNRYYQSYISSLTEEDMMPGVRSFINELSKQGIPIALVSASSNARMVLERLDIMSSFDVIVDPSQLKKGKPDPEIFMTAADRLGVPYDSCVAIEDGEAGLNGILETTMYSVGVGTAEYLNKADWKISTTESLTVEQLKRRFDEKSKYAK